MSTAEDVLGRFAAAWKAGEHPRIEEYADQVDPTEVDTFLDMAVAWMDVAPDPPMDQATYAAIAATPAIAATAQAIREDASLWPALLPQLREKRGLSVGDLAAKVTAALGIRGADARTEHWLRRMEDDRVDPAGVSRRVFDALGAALKVPAGVIADAGDVKGWRPAAAAGGGLLWRTDDADMDDTGHALDVIAELASIPMPAASARPAAADAPSAPPRPDDLIDDLFTLGR